MFLRRASDMRKRIDLSEKKFCRLSVLKKVPKPEHLATKSTYWLCQCDCGSDQRVVIYDSLVSGKTKSCGCLNRELLRKRKGHKSSQWKGGRTKRYGYFLLRKPNHPNSNSSGYVMEHIYVMTEHLGRSLTKKEQVHHKNGIRDDNRLENLELCIKKTHHNGKKVKDLIKFCEEFLFEYDRESLSTECIKGLNY